MLSKSAKILKPDQPPQIRSRGTFIASEPDVLREMYAFPGSLLDGGFESLTAQLAVRMFGLPAKASKRVYAVKKISGNL
jgi:hypothetical protein